MSLNTTNLVISDKDTTLHPQNIVKRKIDQLDLRLICRKIMHISGKGWSEKKVERVSHAYKNFLFISFMYKEKATIVPTEEVDDFWHYHILDTKKYYEDCMDIFGEMIHHSPYLGLDEKSGKQELASAFEETKSVYLREFGKSFPEGVKAAFCNVPPQK
ncbi:MAG: hypothetical protein AAF655_23530 [Bacteroidota bacterium]